MNNVLNDRFAHKSLLLEEKVPPVRKLVADVVIREAADEFAETYRILDGCTAPHIPHRLRGASFHLRR